jgi:hypothetical protein
MIRSVSDVEKEFVQREIQGPTPHGERIYRGKSRNRPKNDLVSRLHGEKTYKDGNPGTDPLIWWVAFMEKGFIERKIQGPTP